MGKKNTAGRQRRRRTADRHRHQGQGSREDRAGPVARARRHLLAVSQDAQLPLERGRSDVQHAASHVHGPVHRAVERARRDRRAHPLAGLSRRPARARNSRSSRPSRKPKACPRRWTWCGCWSRATKPWRAPRAPAFPAAEKAGDESTCDLLTQRLQIHEKTAWMLRSLLK